MSPTSDVLEMLLKQAGFQTGDGRRHRGLMDADEAQAQAHTSLRYGALFAEMSSDSDFPGLIYETAGIEQGPGTPCIYLTGLDDPSPERIFALRGRVWNHGRIPTLWIVTPSSVRIYDAFARPSEEDQLDITSHMLGELQRIGDRLEGLQAYHKSQFDTGAFWRSGPGSRIDARQRVDQSLLRDLADTEELLRREGLPASLAHALLGRTIFVKYLEDRGILKPEHFEAYGRGPRFGDLLENKNVLYSFFDWLRATFNGDLFPPTSDEFEHVKDHHLDILLRFLSGHSMRGYPDTQARLWPYSFRIIPIELVSSIYETFAHAQDPATAEVLSIHYTRFTLVELVLSLGMRDLPDNARILDPACGSGAFLVEAFRRFAWNRSAKLGRPLNRQELHELLRTQIFGIDIDRDAVYVAAFSLYLALLEMDPDPQPPDALKLPPLLGSSQEIANLYVQDFLNPEHRFNHTRPFVGREFDLIVSNPPWTALKESTAPRDPDNPQSGAQWGIVYTKSQEIPDAKPDQAFMWRARDFVGTSSRIALIVGSRLFHQVSPTGKRWRDKFLDTNVVHHVINLSDLVNDDLLFGWRSSTRLPASVVVYSPGVPESDHLVEYIAPKWYPGIRHRDEILLTSADIQTIPQRLLREMPFLWKAALRGTPRDYRLLERLLGFSSLDALLDQMEIRRGHHRAQGISFGRGAQRDASHLIGLPFLSRRLSGHQQAILAAELPLFSRSTIARRSNQVVLQLPALVLARALKNFRPDVLLVEPSGNQSKLVIWKDYYGVSFPRHLSWLAYRLHAVLSSDIPLYWAFMTSSALGVSWKLIEINDWLSVPIPASILDQQVVAWQDAVDLLLDSRSRALGSDQEALNRSIFDLYNLTGQESLLIRDTVQYTVDAYLKRSKRGAENPPSVVQLRAYAQRVCSQLNGIIQHAGRELTAAICIFPQGSPLAACNFKLRKDDGAGLITEATFSAPEDLLSVMSNNLRAQVSDNLYVQRDLRVYDEDSFWIIKPAEGRLWSEAAALNDADLVVDEHMETAQW